MNWYIQALKNYFNFSGRSRRKEFWMYTLFMVIFIIISMILDIMIGIDFKINIQGYEQSLGFGPIYIFAYLFHMIPTLSAIVRRLHDSDRSGWWYFGPVLLMIVPYRIFLEFILSPSIESSATISDVPIAFFTLLIAYLVGFGLSITFFVFLFFDGTKGDNRFGPSRKYDSKGQLMDLYNNKKDGE